MIIPLNFNEIKDKNLLEWINKTRTVSRSAFIRLILEEYMKNEMSRNVSSNKNDNVVVDASVNKSNGYAKNFINNVKK